MEVNKIIQGDCLEVLKTLESESVDCCITSPPYWGLRDYGVSGQLGLEKTPEEYVAKMVEVFKEVRRVLKKEGTCWLNLGDSYATQHAVGTTDDKTNWKHGKLSRGYQGRTGGIGGVVKGKDLVGIPWRVAFALQADGWYLRQDIIWHKPNPMPESVTDRCTKAHEYIFLLAKSQKYYFDNDAIREIRLTEEDRPDGIVRDREWGYDSKQKKMREYNELKKKVGTWTADTDKSRDLRAKIGFKAHTKKLSLTHPLGRNRRSVWTITTKPFKDAHFATFPEDLIVPMVKAGCPEGGIVLDPFIGSGTTALVAKKLGRNYIGIELSGEYVKMANKRLAQKTIWE